MTHAVIGPNLVKPFVNERVISIISHHHDHFDGSGLDQKSTASRYPGRQDRRRRRRYQAMTSDRPYRHAMSRLDAIEELVIQRFTVRSRYRQYSHQQGQAGKARQVYSQRLLTIVFNTGGAGPETCSPFLFSCRFAFGTRPLYNDGVKGLTEPA
jgi:hypothetical protein